MAAFRLHGRRFITCVMLCFGLFGVYYLFTFNSLKDIRDRYELNPSHLACQHPYLDLDNPEIARFFHKEKPLSCDSSYDWVVVNRSRAVIIDRAKKENGDIECSYTELLWSDDENTKRGFTTTTRETFILQRTDFYEVVCIAKNKNQWSSTIAGIRQDMTEGLPKSWNSIPADSLKLNVLIIGYDSLSRNTFIRSLPKTYSYLKELDAVVLEGYNIVGDGTPQALIPILTGKTELELPETRKRMGDKASFVDAVYPFIWSDFRNSGYVTLFAEDQPHIGTFNYRLKGFEKQATSHYMRPFFVHVYPSYSSHPTYCFRSTPRHKVGNKVLAIFNFCH